MIIDHRVRIAFTTHANINGMSLLTTALRQALLVGICTKFSLLKGVCVPTKNSIDSPSKYLQSEFANHHSRASAPSREIDYALFTVAGCHSRQGPR